MKVTTVGKHTSGVQRRDAGTTVETHRRRALRPFRARAAQRRLLMGVQVKYNTNVHSQTQGHAKPRLISSHQQGYAGRRNLRSRSAASLSPGRRGARGSRRVPLTVIKNGLYVKKHVENKRLQFVCAPMLVLGRNINWCSIKY